MLFNHLGTTGFDYSFSGSTFDDSGNIYLSGHTGSPFFGPTLGLTECYQNFHFLHHFIGSEDVILVKLDSDFNVINGFRYGFYF